MSLVDITKLGTIAAREWIRLTADALGDVSGHSLPFTADDVATPLFLDLNSLFA
jgi:hypothetical protein